MHVPVLRQPGLPRVPRPACLALQEAWNAIQKKHPALPVLFVSAGEDKAMAYAGVPQDLSKQLPAGELRGLLARLVCINHRRSCQPRCSVCVPSARQLRTQGG